MNPVITVTARTLTIVTRILKLFMTPFSKQGWPSWQESVKRVHVLQAWSDLEPSAPPRARLAFDELLAMQLALAMVRHHRRRRAGRVVRGDGRLRTAVQANLPYRLTSAQQRTLGEIKTDLAQPTLMLRLLQGDVGSGKTAVALLAMATAIEAGAQAALMAPTEVLVRQHMRTFAPIAEATGIRLAVLTGREKGKERTQTLEALKVQPAPTPVNDDDDDGEEEPKSGFFSRFRRS